MKTVLTSAEQIAKLENELKLKAALGRAYFDDEATEMKARLQSLRGSNIFYN